MVLDFTDLCWWAVAVDARLLRLQEVQTQEGKVRQRKNEHFRTFWISMMIYSHWSTFILYCFSMASRIATSAFQCLSIRCFLSSSSDISSLWMLTNGANLVRMSVSSCCLSFKDLDSLWTSSDRLSILVSKSFFSSWYFKSKTCLSSTI